MRLNALIIVGVLPLVLLYGCSQRTFNSWAQDVGLQKKPAVVNVGPAACTSANLPNGGVLYIDASTTYFDPSGFAIVFGRDGKPCRLNLRYFQ